MSMHSYFNNLNTCFCSRGFTKSEMFEHSVKVPRVYKLASNIVKQVKEEGASLKSLVFQEKNKRNHKIQALFALVLETVKHDSQLSELFTKTGLLVKEPRLDPWLARILLTELLWGKQELHGESKPVLTIQQYRDQCFLLLGSLDSKVSHINSQKVIKPRYIRINTLRLTAADAVRGFQDEGWNLVRCTSGSYNDFLKQVENLGPDDFLPDYHVKVVFVFPSNTPFYDHPLYDSGEILLQDKATCLAGHLLAPEPGSTVLDMCAAPGMKTTHLAALMKNEGVIYSVEQNKDRYEVLCNFVEGSGASCVKVLNSDVAALTKLDCPAVDYILLDPSCSGSGIHRPEKNDSNFDLESGRVRKLASFQAKLLRHALNEFRTAKRVVYSTCSLYPQENEEVIQDVLLNHKGKFKLVSVLEKLNNNWNNVGNLKYESIGEKCLYARPESDYTSGFFLAVFERAPDDEKPLDEMISNKLGQLNTDNMDQSTTVATNSKIDSKNMNFRMEENFVSKSEYLNTSRWSTSNEVGNIDEIICENNINDDVNGHEINPSKVRSKHTQKRKSDALENASEHIIHEPLEPVAEKKKKKKKNNDTVNDIIDKDQNEEIAHKKKKSKKKDKGIIVENESLYNEVGDTESVKLKTKKTKKIKIVDNCSMDLSNEIICENNTNDEVNGNEISPCEARSKHIKKRKSDALENASEHIIQETLEPVIEKKKKKHNDTGIDIIDEGQNDEIAHKKKKSKKNDKGILENEIVINFETNSGSAEIIKRKKNKSKDVDSINDMDITGKKNKKSNKVDNSEFVDDVVIESKKKKNKSENKVDVTSDNSSLMFEDEIGVKKKSKDKKKKIPKTELQ